MSHRSPLLRIAAACSVIGPIFLLGSDVLLLSTGRQFEWTLGLWLAFLFLIPAVIGFTYYLTSRGSRLAYFGGAFAFFGAVAGASMQVLFRVYAVLAEQGSTQTIEQLRGTLKLIATTQMIGLAWPIGLIILAISAIAVDKGKWLVALLIALGAIAFPIGRIAGSSVAVMLSGIFLLGAFGLISRLLAGGKTTLK